MCISAAVLAGAALVTAAAGTAVTISSANKNAAAQQQMLSLQQEQMREQREMERLQAQQAETIRLEEFRRQRAANYAAMAAAGLGDHMSFLQGIAPAEERALKTDLANIRLGLLGSENRIASEIRVNRLNSSVVSANKTAAIIGAGINFAGAAMQAGSYYGAYNAPGGGVSTSGLNKMVASNEAALTARYGR